MDAVLGFSAPEHANGFLLRMAVAAMLGGLLGVRHGRMTPNAQAFACVALAAAAYVSVFLRLGVPANELAWQLVEAGLCLAPLCGFAAVTLATEQRADDLDSLISLSMATVAGLASGFGAYTWSFLCTALTLLVLVLRNKKR